MNLDELRRACANRWTEISVFAAPDVRSLSGSGVAPDAESKVAALRKVQGKADRLRSDAAQEDIDDLAADLAAIK